MSDRTENLVEVRDLTKQFEAGRSGFLRGLFGADEYINAVDDLSFDIQRGEILGLAGQSGCGKSTLGELLTALQKPTEGSIRLDGEEVTSIGRGEMKEFRRRCQIIFQDPYESMNPRFSVARLVGEPLKIHGIGNREERDARTIKAVEDAGLEPADEYLGKIPQELSGGERQRALIARAIVLDPDFLVADEPVSMLDVSIRTGILKLFKELQRQRDLTLLYISHDLSTINFLTDRTMIMYLGNAVEIGPTNAVIQNPTHPYTESLIESVPNPDPDMTRTRGDSDGDVPEARNLPDGCRYHPRCKYATEECRTSEPDLEVRTLAGEIVGDTPAENGEERNRRVACYHPVDSS